MNRLFKIAVKLPKTPTFLVNNEDPDKQLLVMWDEHYKNPTVRVVCDGWTAITGERN